MVTGHDVKDLKGRWNLHNIESTLHILSHNIKCIDCWLRPRQLTR
jgi:hypothetical protein